MARLDPTAFPGWRALPVDRGDLARTALVLALLAATAAAFVVAQRLKLEPAPLRGVRVTKVFSPVCRCPSDRARIVFHLREPDSVEVLITNPTGRSVRLLTRSTRVGHEPRAFVWDGRDDAGALVPDGTYQPRVHLRHSGRTFDLPNRIVVDAAVPRVTLTRARPRVISPDGDGRSDGITIRYRVNEPAVTTLDVDGVRRTRVRGTPLAHKLRWNGRVDGRLRAGTHRLQVVSRDLAGNVGRSEPVTVRVRFVALPHGRYVVRPNGRVRVYVDTDARRVRWQLGSRRGRGGAHPLVVRAPSRPGRYALVVRVDGHAARAAVVVTRPPGRPVR